jgi:tRNA pseudouridine38-40 synthase
LKYQTTERTLYNCALTLNEYAEYRECILSLEGDHFLYKMARTVVGTIIWVARGKLSLDLLPHLFVSRDRTLAGMTAPCHGLALEEVTYREKLWK